MTEEEHRQQWIEAQYVVMGWWIDKQIEHAALEDNDSKKFWESRKKSREDIYRELEGRPLPERLVIMGKMNANHMAVQNARRNKMSEQQMPEADVALYPIFRDNYSLRILVQDGFRDGAKAQRELLKDWRPPISQPQSVSQERRFTAQGWVKLPSVEEMATHMKDWLKKQLEHGQLPDLWDEMVELHRWLQEER